MMDFDKLQKQAYAVAFDKGWWDGVNDDCVRQHFLKIHEETVEAERCFRCGECNAVTVNGAPVGLPVELADIVIVAMNLSEQMGFDLEAQILRKLKYNAGRPYRHGDAA